MSAKHALLGLLLDRPAYRYQLGERLQQRLGPGWAINSGHLYQTVERMERDGLIERIGGAERARRARHVFAITEEGAEEFERWFEEDVEGAGLSRRRSLMVKITLGGPERLKVALKQIEAYEHECTVRLQELLSKREEIRLAGVRVHADHVLLRIGLSGDIKHLEGDLEWARETLEMVAWLLRQDAIWPSARGRSVASSETARDRQSARKELFGRIAARELRPMHGKPKKDRDG